MQYGNIQPSFDVEAATHEEAMELGLQRLKVLWDRTATKPLEIERQGPAPVATPQGVLKRCRVSGTEVIFDPVAHTYHDHQGNRYMGGSTFAAKYKSKFAADTISGKMAEKAAVDAQQILDMWALNAEASATFGTSVHAALQLYGEYVELSRAIKGGSDESALTSNPVLRPIVEKFFTEERKREKAFYEEFVADAKLRHCGLIDRLVAEDDGLWVEDFKTNASVEKSETILKPFKGVVPNTALGAYWLQLSFYARILAAAGRTVKGLRVHHYTGGDWVTHEHEVVDLSEALS
ncbi:hypothetical protein [Mycobacterium phage WXIN]|nr:hypothetical protein [Mycobacterium phage WXIN]